MQGRTSPARPYGASSRGITARDVELAADALLRSGERPTIERVREKIGRGSPNTINPLLDVWWKHLAARLEAGPAALHRLPETVAHVAEALWMQALDEARRRADQELSRQARSAAKHEEDLEVRSHVLTLREGELQSRLEGRERDVDELRLQLRALNLRARKDQATIVSQAARIADLENRFAARVQARPQKRNAAWGNASPKRKATGVIHRHAGKIRPATREVPVAARGGKRPSRQSR
jgi:Plasmid replication region DNA-binding N-term